MTKFVSIEWINTCKEYFPKDDYISCDNLTNRIDSICEGMLPVWEWGKGVVNPVVTGSKWVWDETGEAYGPPGQFILVAALAFLAMNLLGSNKDVKTVHKREVYQLVDRRFHNLQTQKKFLRKPYGTC